MTVSISKGKITESSTAHNNRKNRLKNATVDKIKKFYDQAGHKRVCFFAKCHFGHAGHSFSLYAHLNQFR